MESSSFKPSFIWIVQSDYIAMIAAAFPLVCLIMYVAVSYFGFFPALRGGDPIQGEQAAPLFLYGLLLTLLICVPIIVWRIKSIQGIFANGVETPGQITKVSFFRDRGRVEYTYHYQEQDYAGGNAIMKTKRSKRSRPVKKLC